MSLAGGCGPREAYGRGVVGFGVVVLAGGGGRRLGGAGKPILAVGGEPMLGRVLGAVDGGDPRVVVGPESLVAVVPAGVRVVQEEPAGGGPVAGLAAGLAALTAHAAPGVVVVLAADLPLLTPDAVDRLVAGVSGVDGAVFVDGGGRRQWLCGAWSTAALAGRLGELAATGPLTGRAMRELFGPLRIADVVVDGGRRPPWYDCDTPADLADAERRLT